MAKTLNNLADRLTVNEPRVSGRLTIYPLFFSGGKKDMEEEALVQKEIHYLLLEEALDKGTFEVGEISESGSVNTIVVTNQTNEPVLILDGEELIHLSIFPATEKERPSRSNIQTPQCRRRGMGSDDIIN